MKKQKSQILDDYLAKSQIISNIDLIYQYVRRVDVECTPKIIASKLDLNYHTVRKYCLQLSDQGKLNRALKGKVVFYSIIKQLPLKQEELPLPKDRRHPPLIHGLCLHYSGPTSGSTLPPGASQKGDYILFGTDRRISSWQCYPSSATFWMNTSGNPLDGDSFLFFLDFLQSWSGLPIFRGNGIDRWRVAQYAFGNDLAMTATANQPSKPVNFRLAGFGSLFLEFYDKQMPDGSTTRRFGIHHNQAENDFIELADFLELAANHVITKDHKTANALLDRLESLESAVTQLATIITQNGIIDPANTEGMF